MVLIQLTGLSGAGKTTLAQRAKVQLEKHGYAVDVLDADVLRQKLWPELTYSAAHRQENIRRLAFLGHLLCRRNVVVFLAAINPYEATRAEVAAQYPGTQTVYVCCDLPTLIERDTKGLYARALLPDNHPNKLANLTGVNDPYEPPLHPDLTLYTARQTEAQSTEQLVTYLLTVLP
ncbi:adenylyl-sulfate kinase [Rudanella paleaurantiibacter]|uniref:Adenylyl-sulfate kinase n=1 Tax=Rudanella paleaurantiibacter TaxID=2614655 RepID=A0A7J5TVX3_9BACT|nr:adenylyl-sulfate kinase [Rudanella paleaurantiibacter]KAB7728447.1 adenylyl-sulfate kinase [Rudanella paleaurantiibacter]